MDSDPHGKAHHRATAEAWTAAQAERLDISPEAIETAITRGWTPNLIDEVTSAMELLLKPPIDRDVFGLTIIND